MINARRSFGNRTRGMFNGGGSGSNGGPVLRTKVQNVSTPPPLKSSLAKQKMNASLFVATWDLRGKDLSEAKEPEALLPKGFDIYVLGLQNCASLTSVADTLQTLLQKFGDYKEFSHLMTGKTKLRTSLALLVFARRALDADGHLEMTRVDCVRDRRLSALPMLMSAMDVELSTSEEPTIKDFEANGGAVSMRFSFYDSTFLLINVKQSCIGELNEILARIEPEKHTHVFLFGDFGEDVVENSEELDQRLFLEDFHSIPSQFQNSRALIATRSQHKSVRKFLKPNVHGHYDVIPKVTTAAFSTFRLHGGASVLDALPPPPPLDQRVSLSQVPPPPGDELRASWVPPPPPSEHRTSVLSTVSAVPPPPPMSAPASRAGSTVAAMAQAEAQQQTEEEEKRGSRGSRGSLGSVAKRISFRRESLRRDHPRRSVRVRGTTVDSDAAASDLAEEEQKQPEAGLPKPVAAAAAAAAAAASAAAAAASAAASRAASRAASKAASKTASKTASKAAPEDRPESKPESKPDGADKEDLLRKAIGGIKANLAEDTAKPAPPAQVQGAYGVCSMCSEDIANEADCFQAIDDKYHKKCIKCSDCGDLITSQFFMVNDKMLCQRSYEKLFTRSCAACGDAADPQDHLIRTEKGDLYHFDCFKCAECDAPLAELSEDRSKLLGADFVTNDEGELLCPEHGAKHECAACHKKARAGDAVQVCMGAPEDTAVFHRSCFQCTTCATPIGDLGGEYIVHEDKVYCQADYNKILNLFCACCAEPFAAGEMYLISEDEKFHTTCFKCTRCDESDVKELVRASGELTCKTCAKKN